MTSKVRDTRSKSNLWSLATSSLCVVLLSGCVSAEAPNSSIFGLSALKPAAKVAIAEKVTTAENQPTIETLISGVPKPRPGTVENPTPTQLALASTTVPNAAANAANTAVAAQPVEIAGSTTTKVEQSATTQVINTAVEEPKPSSFLGRIFRKRKQATKNQPTTPQIALVTNSDQPKPVVTSTEIAAIPAKPNPAPKPADIASSAETPNPEVAAVNPALAAPKKKTGFFASIFSAPKKSPTARKKRNRPTVIARRRNSRGDGFVLPGVRKNLFGLSEESENVYAAPIRVASVSGMARVGPYGLRVQRPDVQVSCLKPRLVRILQLVERHYGRTPIITSGYRSPRHNRRVRGARKSTHIYCKAADIQVVGISKWRLAKYLRSLPGRGGVGTYCHTRSVHIDIGTKRDWNWRCRRRRKGRKA